jgi:hypothetical protein
MNSFIASLPIISQSLRSCCCPRCCCPRCCCPRCCCCSRCCCSRLTLLLACSHLGAAARLGSGSAWLGLARSLGTYGRSTRARLACRRADALASGRALRRKANALASRPASSRHAVMRPCERERTRGRADARASGPAGQRTCRPADGRTRWQAEAPAVQRG